MDAQTYAAITDLCARLAGRLEDDILRSVREDYFGGEPGLAEATLLLTSQHENIGLTREEHDLLRSTSDDPVPVIDEVPPVPYRFSADGPAGAPAPSRADAVLAADAARHGGRRLHRAWREPLDGAPDGAKWVYVLETSETANVLGAFAGLSARLWVALREKWPLEVVVEGRQLPPYQTAALASARQIWSV
ncbi:hypothetical protein [Lentzea flava]|uniref:Uncharacterized protein n=1 Tax=Lentzea flava TaxID=103732 RepID=A0ABQ2UDU7_9PSEU|nr:hypothetical protein [Lentzea flava]MCP2196404.1 hypothetical protein [Lentzea flava]GGU18060.1 hypothetical protein GCM10010178_07700 [Lentzea flava]